jgi:hypothetical protein
VPPRQVTLWNQYGTEGRTVTQGSRPVSGSCPSFMARSCGMTGKLHRAAGSFPIGRRLGYGPRRKTCFPWPTGPRCPGARYTVFSVVAAPQVLPVARSARPYRVSWVVWVAAGTDAGRKKLLFYCEPEI